MSATSRPIAVSRASHTRPIAPGAERAAAHVAAVFGRREQRRRRRLGVGDDRGGPVRQAGAAAHRAGVGPWIGRYGSLRPHRLVPQIWRRATNITSVVSALTGWGWDRPVEVVAWAGGVGVRAARGGRMAEASAWLTSITVENVRCFREAQTLRLVDRDGRPAMWTVILGENASGKTTLLQVAVWASYVAAGKLEVHQSVFTDADAAFRLGDRVESALEPPLPYNDASHRLGGWVAKRSDEGAAWQLFYPNRRSSDPSDDAVSIFGADSLGRPAPPLFAFGATRLAGRSTMLRDLTALGVETLFETGTGVLDVEEWLLRLKLDSLLDGPGQDAARQQLEALLAALPSVLPGVSDVSFRGASTQPGDLSNRVRFRTADGDVPFSALSVGYRTMAGWVVELVARLHRHYRDSTNPMAEPCIVLVDEIDLHMHPAWQQQIVGWLRERFPQAQFIVTAHSPLIVQSAEGANVVVLRRSDDGSHVVIDDAPDSVSGWRVDQILTSELFGLRSARPQWYEDAVERRIGLLRQASRSPQEEAELAAIDQRLARVPYAERREDREVMELLRMVAGDRAAS